MVNSCDQRSRRSCKTAWHYRLPLQWRKVRTMNLVCGTGTNKNTDGSRGRVEDRNECPH